MIKPAPGKINVYRAIYGPHVRGSHSLYEGVTAEQLRQSGICVSNKSFAQKLGGGIAALSFELLRTVGGLPVFLRQESAIHWLDMRPLASARANRPTYTVLAHLALDPNWIRDGLVTICTNPTEHYQDDRILTLDELTAHESGDQPISSECFMPQFPKNNEDIRAACAFYIPRVITATGGPDLTVGQPFIQLDLGISDQRPEE
ncbi:MAG TPA: hypothetical protein VFB59_01655 [Candidatus Saccharimonadales bacterium]|nr:hypothetical protein [Candidatus Saccharimonadales bacterium]